MSKISIKILVLFILMLCVCASILNIYTNAADDYGTTMLKELNEVEKGEKEESTATKSINNIVTVVITIVRIIGVTVAIVMLLAVAMKYMAAAPGEKADIKKSAVVYVVGAIVLFAVTGILGIINTFSSNIKASGTTTP